MNGHRGPGPAPGSEHSPLSLLVNAADAHDPPRGGAGGLVGQRDAAAVALGSLSTNRSLAESLRLRGLASAGNEGSGLPPGFEEQLLFAQQQQQQQQAQAGGFGSALYSQLRDQSILAQLGQQQQLAALLGLGGGGSSNGNSQAQDMRIALAAAQLRQQHQQQQAQQHHHHHHLAQQQQQQQQGSQLTHADIVALSRTGAFPGLSGLLSSTNVPGRGSGVGGLSLADYESLQRLEELERRQRLLVASSTAQQLANPALPSPSSLCIPSEPVSSPRPTMPAVMRPPSLPSRDESIDLHLHQLQQQQQQQLQQQRHSVASPPMLNSGGIVPPTSTSPRHGDNMKVPSSSSAPPSGNAIAATTATAVISADSNKDELEKTPGSVIVPCRARGMPMDHNFKTAYFVIPENVKHGEELICSYFACRNAGIKFRYCSHCKVPVAKRNFRKRHKHGGEEIAHIPGDDSGAEDDDRVIVSDVPVLHRRSHSMQQQLHNNGIPSQITANRCCEDAAAAAADGISSQSADSDNEQDQLYTDYNNNNKTDTRKAKNMTETESNHQGLVTSSMHMLKNGNRNGIATATAVTPLVQTTGVSEDRQKRWMTLLGKRPSTNEEATMNVWLMEVLAVSDLNIPLRPDGNTTSTVTPSATTAVPKASAKASKKHSLIARTASKDNDSVHSEKKHGVSNNNDGGTAAKLEPATGTNADGAGKKLQGSTKDGVLLSNAGKSSLLKKKRPMADLVKKNEQNKSEDFVTGSFAKWKERKRQKKQSKIDGSSNGGTAEGSSTNKDQDSASTGDRVSI